VRTKKTKREALQELVEQYRNENHVDSVNLEEAAAWMLRHKHWQPRLKKQIDILKEELSEALREEFFHDPQGRRVRKKHAQKIFTLQNDMPKQLVLWHDITTATRPQMQACSQQRRQGIVMDCKQLKTDIDSYNENFNKSVPIKMLWDFTDDLADLEFEDNEK
jgi:hypothetical protein